MIISIGCDHGGYLLKEDIKKYLEEKGMIVVDHGCYSVESVHYPIYAEAVSRDVQNRACNFGILICTTGIGVSISANKFKGIRAAIARSEKEALLTRSHNDSNILCLGAMFNTLEEAKVIVDTFINTEFSNSPRHQIRIDMIKDQEENQCKEK